MKGIEKITQCIMDEAQAKVQQIDEAAKAACDELRLSLEAEAEALYRKKAEIGSAACEQDLESRRRLIRMEQRKAVLAYKQEQIDICYQKAADLICDLPEQEAIDFLSGLAVKATVSGREEILLNAKDRAAYGDAVVNSANKALEKTGRCAMLKLSDDTGDFAGGLKLIDGDISMNCTIELLTALCKEETAGMVADKLFSE